MPFSLRPVALLAACSSGSGLEGGLSPMLGAHVRCNFSCGRVVARRHMSWAANKSSLDTRTHALCKEGLASPLARCGRGT